MQRIKNHFNNLCQRLDRHQTGVFKYSLGVAAVTIAVVLAGPFFPSPVTTFPQFATLVEGAGAILVVTPMMLSLHGEYLRRNAGWAAYQKRDLDQWAKELVNEEPKLDVHQLQKALDLRELEIECQEIDQRVWDVVEEDLTLPELEALQRALDQRASQEMGLW